MDTIIYYLKTLYASYSPEGLEHLIASGGILVLIAIIFSETGLLVGVVLPGDSLLVTAGVLAARGPEGIPLFNIWEVNIVLILAAFIGDQLNYFLGRRTGHAIFTREDSLIFKKRYAHEAHEFYLQHGGKAIVLARFIPILRTFVPFIAGVAEMPYSRYFPFSILASFTWITSLVWLGYLVGQTPFGRKLHYVILLVIFVSFLPLIFGLVKRYLAGQQKSQT